jgi:hypothetical protein
LTSLISTRRLNALARRSGLVQRRRKVVRRRPGKDPGGVATRLSEKHGSDRLVEELFERLQDTEARFAGVLQSFRDVLMTDSTLVKLHDLLEKRFPACRTNHTKAAAKLHVVMSTRGQGPRSVTLTSGRQHDGPVFRVGRWAAIFAAVSNALLDLVLAPARLARESAKCIEAMLLHEAVDPNLSRRLLLARVENGVAS